MTKTIDQYTRGPYRVGPFGEIWVAADIRFDGGKWHEMVPEPRIVASPSKSLPEHEANAHLLAASFDMLDVLLECEEYFDQRADADCDQDGYIPNEEMTMLQKVRDALQKAGMK